MADEKCVDMASRRYVIPHPTDPSLALVPLTRGHFATISAVDSEIVGRSSWAVSSSTRPGRYAYSSRGGKTVYLHRLVASEMGIVDAETIDHINGNGIDCRRSNLRPASRSDNAKNRGRNRNNASGALGVSPHRNGKWVARVGSNGKNHYLGSFHTVAEAAAAAIEGRRRLFGDFAASEGRDRVQ